MLLRLSIAILLFPYLSAGAEEVPVASPLEVTVRRALPVEDEPQSLVDTGSLTRILPEGRKSFYSRCVTTQPVIAMTFDDGPDPVLTPRLLDLLKERGIHATFFMVGRNVAAFPAIVKRMAAEGHEVANHSWSHPLLTQMGPQNVESQLRRTHDAIVAACGTAPLLYRPPYGAIGLSQRTRVEKSFGYPAILWDVDTLDWQKPRNAQKVYDRVLTQTKPGSIILCHDIHETTIAAMPAILDDLKGRGYAFATVTQLIALTTPPPIPDIIEPETVARPLEAIPASATPASQTSSPNETLK
jgi:peptidoglycan/xylan/chitin deacetylase (PgdA/CDA1 family)